MSSLPDGVPAGSEAADSQEVAFNSETRQYQAADVYIDENGMKYYVDPDSGDVIDTEQGLPPHAESSDSQEVVFNEQTREYQAADVYTDANGNTYFVDPDSGDVIGVEPPAIPPGSQYQGQQTRETVVVNESRTGYEVVEEQVDVYTDANGNTIYIDPETGEAVDFEWADGQQPVYQGDVLIDGEPHAVYEMGDGSTVVIDADGNVVSDLESADIDVVDNPVHGEVYYVPMGPPTYDTAVYDAETGEQVMRQDSGGETLGAQEGYWTNDAPGEANEVYSTYQPPGADYYLVLDDEGNVIDQQPIPPDEVWSIGGIVTYYDDGGLVVDAAGITAEVDVIGPEGGISFEVGDLGDLTGGADEWLGGFGASVQWDEKGIEFGAHANVSEFGSIAVGGEAGADGFEVWVDVETQIPLDGLDIGASLSASAGLTEDGQIWMEGEIDTEFKIGLIDVKAGVDGYAEVGPQGLELSGGWDGSLGVGGAFIEGGQRGSFVYNEDGATVTYTEFRGIGLEGVGSLRAGYEVQVQTDFTREGTEVTGGIFGQTADADGDATGTIGGYVTADESGLSSEVRDELLDTGVTRERYDRHHDTEKDTSGVPSDVEGGDAEHFGIDLVDDRTGRPATGGFEGREGGRSSLPDAFEELDVVQPTPETPETTEAGPEHAPGSVKRPDERPDERPEPRPEARPERRGDRETTEAGREHAPGGVERPDERPAQEPTQPDDVTELNIDIEPTAAPAQEPATAALVDDIAPIGAARPVAEPAAVAPTVEPVPATPVTEEPVTEPVMDEPVMDEPVADAVGEAVEAAPLVSAAPLVEHEPLIDDVVADLDGSDDGG